MPAGEFEDWIRYNRVEPFGFVREEARFAVLAANTLAASPNKFRDHRSKSAAHWMYKPPQNLTVEQSLDMMRAQFPSAKTRKRVPINGH